MFLTKNNKVLAVMLSLALALALTGCGQEKQAAQRGGAQVKAMNVIQQDTPLTSEYAGSLVGKDEVKVQARVSGKVVEKYVQGGQYVTEGQPLYRIDSRQYESAVLNAHATLAQSEANLNNAGYACDQVADDGGLDTKQGVAIQAVGRAKMRDFLHQVQRVGMRCTEIVIKNLAGLTNEEIFNTQIELAKTVVGARGGMDFITLQKYVNVNAYDRSKITIDLSGVDENGRLKALEFTPEVFMAMTVPQNAHFTIQFTFDNTVSGI